MAQKKLKYWFYSYLRTDKEGTCWANAFISHHKDYFPLYEVSVRHAKTRNPRGVVVINFIEITEDAFDDYMKQFNEEDGSNNLYATNKNEGEVIKLFPREIK